MSNVKMFQTTPRVVMGPGSLDNLAGEARRLGGSAVMVITDKGLVDAGIVGRAEEILAKAGMTVHRFDGVEPDPRYEIAIEAAQRTRDAGADLLVGIGGGSPQDIAKVASVLVTNEGEVQAFFGVDLIPNPGLKTIMIPTTAGTGSEVTPIAILSDEGEKLKKGIVSPYLFPSTAILDAELTLGLPAAVTAATGMDALIHAVEAYTSRNAYWMSDLLAERSMRLISENLRTAYADGHNIEARSRMLEASLLAGMAFANAGVTAVHAFAYPIGAEFHIPHGVANSIMLVPVMEFNMMAELRKFAGMAELLGENTVGMTVRESAEMAVEALRIITEDVRIPASLAEFGVTEEDVPRLAEGVMKVTRLLANNPRELTLDDAKEIYLSVL